MLFFNTIQRVGRAQAIPYKEGDAVLFLVCLWLLHLYTIIGPIVFFIDYAEIIFILE